MQAKNLFTSKTVFQSLKSLRKETQSVRQMEQELVHLRRQETKVDSDSRCRRHLVFILKEETQCFQCIRINHCIFSAFIFLPFNLEQCPTQCIVLHSFTSYQFPTSFLSFDNICALLLAFSGFGFYRAEKTNG